MSALPAKSPAARPGAAPARPATLPARFVLRPAQPGDEAPLQFFFDVTLRRDYFLRRGQLRDMLRGGRHRVLVAEIGGVLVGIAVTTRRATLVNLLIHPAFRGVGLGSALVDASGAQTVRVKTDMRSGDPRRFYEQLGFKAIGPAAGKPHIERMCRPRRAARNSARAAGVAVE